MTGFEGLVVLTALLVALVAGLLLGFAAVVMPGIATLEDRAFLKAFQVIDRVIQRNQPIFMLVWVGSVPAMLTSAIWGFFVLEGLNVGLLLSACGLYLLCVQAPTVIINIPLNHGVQSLNLEALDETAAREARQVFEERWVLWNRYRTAAATVSAGLLSALLARL